MTSGTPSRTSPSSAASGGRCAAPASASERWSTSAGSVARSIAPSSWRRTSRTRWPARGPCCSTRRACWVATRRRPSGCSAARWRSTPTISAPGSISSGRSVPAGGRLRRTPRRSVRSRSRSERPIRRASRAPRRSCPAVRRARSRTVPPPGPPGRGPQPLSRAAFSTIGPGMKFGLMYANAGPFGFPDNLAHLARTAAVVGIGIGWLREECEALGIPFEDRAARTAEAVRALRSLWKETPEAFAGKYFRWPPLESNPKPVQRPGVPIVVGGHTPLAVRRAARYGDGFFPGVDTPEKLKPLLAALGEECARLGRNPRDIEITAGRAAMDLDTVRRYQDLGVARLTIPPPAFDQEGLCAGLHEFGDRIIAKLSPS